MPLEASSDVIERLQEALRWEHAGIVQFQCHAFRLKDLATLHAVEGISRQDMRHFKWLSDMVVKLGGNPTLEREAVYQEMASPLIWLGRDVALIEDGIARYRLHLDLLAGAADLTPALHDDLVRLYRRILGDKEEHRHKVIALVNAWRERGELPVVGEVTADHPAVGTDKAAARGFLDFAIGHEYEVILQYLHHAFLLKDQGASRAMEEIAIEEMRHLGWLSEMMVEQGGCPYWEARRLELTEDPILMLELDQAREIEVEADYQQMTAALADPGIRQLFDRIGEHEKFHAGTIGTLIEKLKAVTQTAEAAVSGAAPPCEPPPPPPVASKCPYTVGSLLGAPQT